MEHFENELVRILNYDVIADLRWKVANHILVNCALISAQIDGEDSAGRSKLRLMTAGEVANRAMDIADEMVNQADSRGWFKKPKLDVIGCSVFSLDTFRIFTWGGR